MSERPNKLFLLELNEFSLSLVREAAASLSLPGFETILGFKESTTSTADTNENLLLDPWVQWVSVHTGQPASTHGVRHLGEPPQETHKQIWDLLAEQGKTVGVWGALNAVSRSPENTAFFVPDPWTFSEQASPKKLNGFVELPRYAARNYLKLSVPALLRGGLKFLVNIASFSNAFKVMKMAPALLWRIMNHPFKAYPYFTLAEYLAGRACLKEFKKSQPDFTLLFANSLAHVQHYYWKARPVHRIPEICFVLRVMDELIREILDTLPEGTTFVVANGLSQRNASHDEPWVMYRQIDHKRVLNALKVSVESIEPLMTHDAHLFFSSTEKAAHAFKTLSEVKVLDEPLFYVEKVTPTRLFYRIAFTKPLPTEATFESEENDFLFSDYFKTIVQRTGVHIQRGTLFCNEAIFPGKLKNHEIYHALSRFFEKGGRSYAGQDKAS